MNRIRKSIKYVRKKRESFANSSESEYFNPKLSSSNSSFLSPDSDLSLCLSSVSNIDIIRVEKTEDHQNLVRFLRRKRYYGFIPKNTSIMFSIVSRDLASDDSRIIMNKLIEVLQPTIPNLDKKIISNLIIFKVFPAYIGMTSYEYYSKIKINEGYIVNNLMEATFLKFGSYGINEEISQEVYNLFNMLVMKKLFVKTTKLLKNLTDFIDDSENFLHFAHEVLMELGFKNFSYSATDFSFFENYNRIIYSCVMKRNRNIEERTCQSCNDLFRFGDSLVVTPEINVYHETCARKCFLIKQSCAR